jgi:hypothetical protein
MQTLLNVDQLGACIHKSAASIRSDATRNPTSLPPICRLPGTKRLLWRIEDVERWIAQHIQGQCVATPAIDDSIKPKRGRPTKGEQFARHRQVTRGVSTNARYVSPGA